MRRPSGLTIATFALSVLLLPTHSSGQPATLVRDLDPTPSLLRGNDQFGLLGTVGGRVLFSAKSSYNSDLELLTTDGTPAGTTTLADFGALFVAKLGNIVLFLTLPRTASEVELWATDGTRAGTYRLASAVGPGIALPAAPLGGALLFLSSNLRELWTTDGTPAGTRRLADLGGVTGETAVARGHMYLTVGGSATELPTLWVSDGTAAGTRTVAPVPQGNLQAVGDRALILGYHELWGTDGTAAGTRRLATFDALYGSSLVRGDEAYFTADDGVHGPQIWQSDATAAGTRRITAIGSPAFNPADAPLQLERLGNRVLFAARGAGGVHLFVTDGTPASTTQLTSAAVQPAAFVTLGGRVLFFADDGFHGAELWASDGTRAGTALVRDACPGSCPASIRGGLVPLFGSVFYSAYKSGGEDTDQVLWRTDGTAAGTRPFADPGAGRGIRSLPGSLLGGPSGTLYFVVAVRFGYEELWASDGTPAGSRLLESRSQVGTPPSSPSSLAPLGDHLLFAACDGTNTQIWATDGTSTGTAPAADASLALPCQALLGPAGLGYLTAVGGEAYFLRAPQSGGATELWRTDGTPSGAAKLLETTAFLSNLVEFRGELWFTEESDHDELWHVGAAGVAQRAVDLPGVQSVNSLTSAGGRLYFVAQTGDLHASQGIFTSDGTAAGTREILPVAEARPSFTAIGDTLYFLAGQANEGQRLWATDGTATGTRALSPSLGSQTFQLSLSDLAVLGGSIYFLLHGVDEELWRSDGTAATTGRVASFAYSPSPLPELAVAGGRLFFAADDGLHGAELWASDGTAAGTYLVRDIVSGPDGSAPAELTGAGGRLYFAAEDLFHGTELWQSDGTAGGTHLVQDIAPGSYSSAPMQLVTAGDRLYFVADDGIHDRELWTLPLAATGAACQPAADHLCLSASRFRVEAAWRDFQGNVGNGTAVALTADTGYFWFFSPANVEVMAKVLDGRGVNQAFWVFYGALSSVEYALTVTDTQTGLSRRYENLAGDLASVADTNGFGPLGAFDSKRDSKRDTERPRAAGGPRLVSARTDPRAATGTCAPGANQLCLSDERFGITVDWKDFQGHTGRGTAVPLTGDTGYFWFFDPASVEVVTKVLDGRAVNEKFWVFYGALSSVEYSLTVTDSQTGAIKVYKNASGNLGSVADTAAF